MKITSGASRVVILVGRWAIKLPHLGHGWRRFCLGMVANMDERLWSGFDERLCPVLFCAPLGLFLVMRRVDRVLHSESEVEEIGVREFFADVPVAQDENPDNYGYIGNRLVCVDYAPVFTPSDTRDYLKHLDSWVKKSIGELEEQGKVSPQQLLDAIMWFRPLQILISDPCGKVRVVVSISFSTAVQNFTWDADCLETALRENLRRLYHAAKADQMVVPVGLPYEGHPPKLFTWPKTAMPTADQMQAIESIIGAYHAR